jgi:hypothetical protein
MNYRLFFALIFAIASSLSHASLVTVNFYGSLNEVVTDYSSLLGTNFTGYFSYETNSPVDNDFYCVSCPNFEGHYNLKNSPLNVIVINTSIGKFEKQSSLFLIQNSQISENPPDLYNSDLISIQSIGGGTGELLLTLLGESDWLSDHNIANVNFDNYMINYSGSYLGWHLSYGPAFSSNNIQISNIYVSEIPIPATAWLMGCSLLSLTAAARRKKI